MIIRKRRDRHIYTAKHGDKSPVSIWLRNLLVKSLRPIVVLLEITNNEERECFWIKHYRELNKFLTNRTNGGINKIIFSDEMKKSIAQSRIGKIHSEKTKEKMRQTHILQDSLRIR